MENQNSQSTNINTSSSISSSIPPSVNPPSGKSKLSRTLIIGIILLLLLAGSAAGFYVFKPLLMNLVSKPSSTPTPLAQKLSTSPTPDSTTNWKIYLDSETGFTFKYPPTWEQKTETPDIEGVIRTIHRFTGLEGEVSIGFNGLGGGCPDRQTDKQVNGGTLTYCYFGMGEDYPNSPEIWKHASYHTTNTSMPFIAIANPKNNTILINKILSTFKFTGKKTIDTSGWETYSNSKFSIQHPPSWLINNQNLLTDSEVGFKSSDYADDGGMPIITKGYLVGVSYGKGCVKKYLVWNEPRPNGTYAIQMIESLKDGYIVENGHENLRYIIIPDKNTDMCLEIVVSETRSGHLTPFTNSVYLENKSDFITVAENFKIK